MCINPIQALPIPTPPHTLSLGPHRGAEAAAAHGAPELSEGLSGGAGGVEALGEKHDAVEEEEGGQAVDDVLEVLDAAKKRNEDLENQRPTLSECGETGGWQLGVWRRLSAHM